VEILSDVKPSDTRRSGQLRFLFTLAVLDEFILENSRHLNKGFTGYLSQCRPSGYKECASATGEVVMIS
jgi:hypothetical protein